MNDKQILIASLEQARDEITNLNNQVDTFLLEKETLSKSLLEVRGEVKEYKNLLTQEKEYSEHLVHDITVALDSAAEELDQALSKQVIQKEGYDKKLSDISLELRAVTHKFEKSEEEKRSITVALDSAAEELDQALSKQVIQKEGYDKKLSDISLELRAVTHKFEKSEEERRSLEEKVDELEVLHSKSLESITLRAQKENELLLIQLAKLQDKIREQGQLISTIDKDRKTQEKIFDRSVIKLEATVFRLKHERNKAQYNEIRLSKELDNFRNKFSHKVVSPIRDTISKLRRPRLSDEMIADINIIATSVYFDAKWYLETYRDVLDASVDPAEHYLISGGAEGRFPSLEFDGNLYLERYQDVKESGMNPLLHYLKCGKREGRQINTKLISG